jgi:F-box/WD-40 domain protein MET30
MLQGLLAQCCFPQLSFLSWSVRDLLKIDFLTALPAEIGLRILCFLDPVSLCKAAQVSRKWGELADDDAVWHRMCEQHIDRKCTKCGWGLPLLDRQRLRTEKRLLQLRLQSAPRPKRESTSRSTPKPILSASSGSTADNPYHSSAYMSDDSSTDNEGTSSNPRKRQRGEEDLVKTKRVCTSLGSGLPDQAALQNTLRPWKDVYRDRKVVATNWKYGRYKMKELHGHTNGVMCLQFDDNILVSGSYDSTIKIWDIETGQELRTLAGHSLGVRCLQFDKTKLVSGSLDGTLKVWDMKAGQVIRTFPGHSGPVISLHFDGLILASGSQDMTVRVRNFKDCSRVVLRGHTDWVNAVKIHAASQTLYSASDDCTVRIWDLVSKTCVRVFKEHAGQVQQILPLPIDFELPETENDLQQQQEEGAQNVAPLALAPMSNRPAHPRYVLSGGLDATIRLWDIDSGRCVRTFFGHLEGVWALAADTIRMISGANDGMVKVWDPRTGRCERTITGHSGPVTCVGLNDRRMATGSEDHSIRLYDFVG